MRVKFESLYGGVIVLLVCLLLWSIWASAQAATKQAAASGASPAASSRPSSFERGVEQLDQHYLTFWLDRVDFLREHTLFGEPLWKYPASLVYVLVVFYASKLIDLVTCVWLKKLAAKTETKIDDLLLGLIHGPIKVIAFAIFLIIGLNMFDWPEKVRLWFSKALIVVVAASLTYLALKIIDLLLFFWKRRGVHEAGDRKFNEQLVSIISKSTKAFTILIAILVTAQNMQINITAALASLSIGGLAVGLAAQDMLANLFGAVAVYVDKPFRVGDQIRLDTTEGTVERVGMRSTRVRNTEGNLVAIPNKTVGNAVIINITERDTIKTTMNLVLVRTLPGEKIKRALELLDQIYRKNGLTQDVWVSFNQFAAGNINIMIVHWFKGTDYQKYLAAMQEMNLAVKERFDAEGIGFA